MLKKLAKYGNSTTLVIDKAILELLNMDESTIVKLHTDGKSLIITPVESADNKKISYAGLDALQTASQSLMAEYKKQGVKLDTDIQTKMQNEFSQVFKKFNPQFMEIQKDLISNEDYQRALSELAKKIDPITQGEEYIKEAANLRWQFYPELKEMDNELSEIAKKYRP